VGNFVFVVDYEEDPAPPEDDIVFAADIRRADIFFLMDTTGSMGGELEQLKADLGDIVIPRIHDLLGDDVAYGAGGFDDYPVGPYGGEPPTYIDRAFYQLQGMTTTTADALAAIDSFTTVDHFGGDCAESAVPALHAVATGMGLGPFLPRSSAARWARGSSATPASGREPCRS